MKEVKTTKPPYSDRLEAVLDPMLRSVVRFAGALFSPKREPVKPEFEELAEMLAEIERYHTGRRGSQMLNPKAAKKEKEPAADPEFELVVRFAGALAQRLREQAALNERLTVELTGIKHDLTAASVRRNELARRLNLHSHEVRVYGGLFGHGHAAYTKSIGKTSFMGD